MGAGSTYKAQRSREKALLRQFSHELNNIFYEFRQARITGTIAVAEELTGSYETARKSYGIALKILEGIEAAAEENPLVGETVATLVNDIEEELKASQEGLKSKQLSDMAVSPEYLLMGTKLYKVNTQMLKLLNN